MSKAFVLRWIHPCHYAFNPYLYGGAQYVKRSEELSNHLQILHAVGCSAEIGKEVQLSRYIDFNLLEDLASQRLQPIMAWKLFTKLGNLGTSYPANFCFLPALIKRKSLGPED